MTFLQTVEDPAGRTRGSWVFDVLVTGFAFLSGVPVIVHADQTRQGLAALLLMGIALPLLVRRIWPLPVFAWVVSVSFIGAMLGARVFAGLAIGIALFTVATRLPRRTALNAAGVLELGLVIGAVRVTGDDWWFDSIFLSGPVVAALGLGLYAGTRRAYLAELHDRAERLERERDQQVELAAVTERQRIAREMHDIVAHHLTVMVALSDGAVATSAASPERAAEVMRSVSATGRRALADTRRLLGVLREPEEGGDLQPVPGLQDLDALIEGVRAAGLPTTFEVHGAPADMPSGVQLTVYRLVQEALTNTLKHGGPDVRAHVRLSHRRGEVEVGVEDDGLGALTPEPVSVGGGLVGMQERVHAYGGEVTSGPRTPSGWAVHATLRLE